MNSQFDMTHDYHFELGAVPQGIKRMWDKDNGKNDVKNTLNAIGYPYALRLSF